jgi:hypothetical protein
MNTMIGYEDFFQLSGAVVTDPAAESGFPASRFRDSKEYLFWKDDVAGGAGNTHYKVDLGDGTGGTPGALLPTYFAIANHTFNLANATWRLQYSDNDSTWTSAIGSGSQSFKYDRIYVVPLDGQGLTAHRYWRFRIENTDATEFTKLAIGEIRLGRAIEFPDSVDWPDLDPYSFEPLGTDSVSQTGFPIRTVTEGVLRRVPFNLGNITTAFLEDDTENTGFKWWRENVAIQGGFSFFHWAPTRNESENIPYQGLWGMIEGRNVRTGLQTPLAVGGHYRVSFNVIARGDVGQ